MSKSNPFCLNNRTALVTGASSGLGRHFAQTLATAGARVAVAARRRDKLDETVELIAAKGGSAVPVVMDVTDHQSVAAAFDDAETALGPVTILVNNAGVPSRTPFLDMGEDEWRQTLDVNLDGVTRVAREAGRRMRAAKTGGSIVNIASVLGLAVLRSVSAYAVSKAAVIQLTRAMALEVTRDNIRVNALAPGYFATDLNRGFLSSDAGQRIIASVPQARVGNLEELDGPLLLLASDAGSFMTGSVLSVDGGASLALG